MGLLKFLKLVKPPPPPEPEPRRMEKMWAHVPQEHHYLEYVIVLLVLLIGTKHLFGRNNPETKKEKEYEQKIAEMARKLTEKEKEIASMKNEAPKDRDSQVRFSASMKGGSLAKLAKVFRKVSHAGNTARRRASDESQLMFSPETADSWDKKDINAAVKAMEHWKHMVKGNGMMKNNVGKLKLALNERLQAAQMTSLAHEARANERKLSIPSPIEDKLRIGRALDAMKDTSRLTEAEKLELIDEFDELCYLKGAVIIEQGTIGHYAYVIKSGVVNLHRREASQKVSKPDFKKSQSDATFSSLARGGKVNLHCREGSQNVPKPDFKKSQSDETNFSSEMSGKGGKFQKVKNKKKGGASTISYAALPPSTRKYDPTSNGVAMPTLGRFKSAGNATPHSTTPQSESAKQYGPRKKTLDSGMSFGELALAFDCRSDYSFIASTPCKVWRISRRDYKYALQSKATNKLQLDIVQVLKNIKVFSVFELRVLERMAKAFKTKTFRDKERIIQKYDMGDSFFIVKSGSVDITDIGLGDTIVDDVRGGPGFWFGEGALLTGEKRAANVDAIGEVVALEMTRTDFEAALGPMKKIFEKEVEKARLRRHVNAISMFSGAKLEEQELADVVDSFEEVVFPAKKNIAQKGKKRTAALYIVNYGEIYVADDKTNSVNRVVENGHFGAQIMQRNANKFTSETTVTAKVETKCWMLTRERLLKVIGDMTRLSEAKAFLSDKLDTTMTMDRLERYNLFGYGAYGKVWLAKDKSTGATYALKAMSKSQINREGGQVLISMTMREKNLLASVDHPLIADLIATMQDKANLYMVMDFIPGGELASVFERLEVDDIVPNASAQFYGACIAEALNHLHSKMICHRDLKPQNIVVDKDGYCVLVDFGFAKVVPGWTYTCCATPRYAAPEMLSGIGHNWSVDLWAFGVMIYEMLVGQNPFEEEDMLSSLWLQSIREWDGNIDFPDPVLDGIEVTADAQDLITRLMDLDVRRRLEFGEKEMLDHPWFNGLTGQKLVNKKMKAPWKPPISSLTDTSNFECFADQENLVKEYENVVTSDFNDEDFAGF